MFRCCTDSWGLVQTPSARGSSGSTSSQRAIIKSLTGNVGSWRKRRSYLRWRCFGVQLSWDRRGEARLRCPSPRRLNDSKNGWCSCSCTWSLSANTFFKSSYSFFLLLSKSTTVAFCHSCLLRAFPRWWERSAEATGLMGVVLREMLHHGHDISCFRRGSSSAARSGVSLCEGRPPRVSRDLSSLSAW